MRVIVANHIELLRIPAIILHRKRVDLSGMGHACDARRILEAGEGADYVVHPNLLVERDDLIEIFAKVSVGMVGAHAVETCRLHRILHLLGRVVVEARCFHVLITQRRHLFQCAFIVLRQHLPHRIKLKPDWQ
ncbi:MAG TPA: hypothetical protein VI386_34160, partial [Candidatus Sulfotelmatobacter sp.]